jgi:AIPR protein
LKPKTVYELFKKYRFGLFFKNVRNPIHRSNYNEKIVETLLKKPNAFWYFNNGITAITKIMPEVGIHAKKIKLEGLQIINGAQTVYSIYQAYQNATRIQRVAMDSDARMTFRLIRSSDEEFNMQITRYTNSQNSMEDRGFLVSDTV